MRRAPGNPIGLILMLLALLVTASTVASGVYLRIEDLTPTLPITLLVWFDEWVIDLASAWWRSCCRCSSPTGTCRADAGARCCGWAWP